jgi:VanZ family protein
MLLGIFIGGEAPGAGSLFPSPWDKLVHFIVYGSIGIFLGVILKTKPLVLILILVVLIGAADEFHQIYIPGRHAGLDDLSADLVGALVALPIISKLRLAFYPTAQTKRTASL